MKPEGNVDKTYTLRAKDVIAKEPRKSKKPAEDAEEFASGGWSGLGSIPNDHMPSQSSY